MSHPVAGLRTRKDGSKYIKYVYGLYSCVLPGHSVIWNRDINAPINMQVRVCSALPPPPRACC